jgi:hypothetical protein
MDSDTKPMLADGKVGIGDTMPLETDAKLTIGDLMPSVSDSNLGIELYRISFDRSPKIPGLKFTNLT